MWSPPLPTKEQTLNTDEVPSIQFSLGELTARVTAQSEETARLRSSHEGLPAKVVALLAPQLVAIESRLGNHDTRIVALERMNWKAIGGGAVILAIVGVYVGHAVH